MSHPARNEECRHAVLSYLVARQPLRYNVDAVARGIKREGGDWTVQETAAALQFLTDSGHLYSSPDGLGSSLYYRASPQGILAVERGSL